jgi:ferrous iron transport protein B
VPVIPTVATKGIGLTEVVDTAIRVIKTGKQKPTKIRYGKEIETQIRKLTKIVNRKSREYPARWLAIKLLEGDSEIEKIMDEPSKKRARKLRKELEKIHGERAPIIVTSERYSIANRITGEVQKQESVKESKGEILDKITLNRVGGYAVLALAVLFMFTVIFTTGDFLTEVIESFLGTLGYTALEGTLIGSLFDGIVAVLTIVIPYLLPFFIIHSFLQASGYLARAAFLMDSIMHKIGLHGKAFIPIVLGYGCSVPACMGCRIMETYRERFLAAFVTTLIPCAARTVIILGLVGTYVGIDWALGIYILNIVVVFLLGRVAFKLLPGVPVGLIMEMPPYRWPKIKAMLTHTWVRLKDYTIIVLPYLIGGSVLIGVLRIIGLLDPISQLLSPVTVGWLGLPAVTGITLIFGVFRKELALILLGTLMGTENFALVLTPIRMIVFTLVSIFYIPCVATMAALKREFGTRRMLYVSVFEVVFAILIGGIAYRLLLLL